MKKFFALLLALTLTGILPGVLQADTSTPKNPLYATALKNSTGAANKKLANQYRQTLLNRFLNYVTYNSQSDYKKEITPDQIETAQKLYKEILSLGFKDAILSEHHYIFVNIPSNLPWEAPILGFSCHYDVTPDAKADNVQAQVINNYQGGPIVLPQPYDGETQVIDPQTPTGAYLNTQIGKTIVTSDGSTLLGADDKSGVAIIMTMLEAIAKNPSKKHGAIQVIIAPNEDVGRAAEFVEETPYRPEIAFDFDGETGGEVMIENFNARQVYFTVKGHPGHQSQAATNGYHNAWTPACELGAQICTPELMPEKSTGRDGYAELHHMEPVKGNTSVAQLDIRLRGYDTNEMDRWEQKADSIANQVAKKFEVEILRQTINNYNNVGECAHPQALAVTQKAFEAAGVPMNAVSVRAGTTASMFVTKGLVGAYTIFTGQNNPHTPTEWLSEDDMFKAFVIGLNLVDEVAKIRK